MKTIMAEEDWKNSIGGASNKDWATGTTTVPGDVEYVRVDPPEINLKPHLCPVCEGRGLVGDDFYEWRYDATQLTATAPTNTACRSCNGAGYILCL